MASDTGDTAEFPAIGDQRKATSRVDVEVAGVSDAGNVRPNNEDHFLVIRFSRSLECLQTNPRSDGSRPPSRTSAMPWLTAWAVMPPVKKLADTPSQCL
jgi:hypothetical protein